MRRRRRRRDSVFWQRLHADRAADNYREAVDALVELSERIDDLTEPTIDGATGGEEDDPDPLTRGELQRWASIIDGAIELLEESRP